MCLQGDQVCDKFKFFVASALYLMMQKCFLEVILEIISAVCWIETIFQLTLFSFLNCKCFHSNVGHKE